MIAPAETTGGLRTKEAASFGLLRTNRSCRECENEVNYPQQREISGMSRCN